VVPRIDDTDKRYDYPECVEGDKVEPEVEGMSDGTVDESVHPLGGEVEDVSVELAEAEHELSSVTVRGVCEESVRREEGKRSVYGCCDGFHADRKSVTAEY